MRIAETLAVFVALHQIARVVDGGGGLKNTSADGPCEPGELVFIGFCNLCLCNTKGVPNQLCARSWCRVSTLLPPRSTSNLTTNKPLE